MAKVGLKDTLTLLAKGYSKKDIDALAEIDAQNEEDKKETPSDPVPEDKKEASKSDPVPETPDQDDNDDSDNTDYKKLYEDLLKENEKANDENKKKDDLIKKIQKNNTNDNILPDIKKKKEDDINSLKDALRSFY